MQRIRVRTADLLKRHNLTVEHLLGRNGGGRVRDGADSRFSVVMRCDVQRSSIGDPATAVASGGLEIIRVALAGNILSIATIDSQRKPATGRAATAPREIRLAVRSVTLLGATVFTFLEKPPAGRMPRRFVPASGSAVLFDPDDVGVRALRASGVDRVPDRRHGWVIDAIEV